MAFVGNPPLFRPPPYHPVKVSVTFTWDIAEGERLYRAWKDYYPDVQIGGPAFGDPGGEFTPGMFVKKGVTITSRGCVRNCEFCFVPEREGKIREYEIKDGWILQDNNILACSEIHQRNVFKMLQRQKKPIDFNGGLDPRLLKEWHIAEFEKLNVHSFWFSCDYPGNERYLHNVADLLKCYPRYKLRCYVLIGHKGETIHEAEKRLNKVYEMGFLPFAQLYQGIDKVKWSKEWDALQRKWCRPAAYNRSEKMEEVKAADTSILLTNYERVRDGDIDLGRTKTARENYSGKPQQD